MAWILIADDDDLVRALWTESLTQAGYRTIQARSGREAIELIRTVVPDLVILDLRMPDLSGDDVLRHLQGTPILCRIPVLIISGFLDDDQVGTDLGLNIVARLPKPIGLSRLRALVAESLAGPTRSLPVT